MQLPFVNALFDSNDSPLFDTITTRSRAESAKILAAAYCQGTLLRNKVEARDQALLGEATSD